MTQTIRLLSAAALSLSFPTLSACGFTPLYATNQPGERAILSNVNLLDLSAAESVEPMLRRAFTARTARDGDEAAYDLVVSTQETANALAVQIDASVTRYNYTLNGSYTLTRRSDGKRIAGSAHAISSFNVVDSQYSTLFAEEAAREKAARMLVEEIERDILLEMAQLEEKEAVVSRKRLTERR